MKKKRGFLLIILLFTLTGYTGCDVKGRSTAESPLSIGRFDRDLYRLTETDTPELRERIAVDYASLLKDIGLSLFRVKDTDTTDFLDRLVNYYSEPALNRLYRDVLKRFETMEAMEEVLGNSFRYLRDQFPGMQLPAVYVHVSGLQQNVIVGDSLLSISLDKYMGADYPLYRDYFYAYQLRKMEPACIVPDYLTAWLLSEYPFKGDKRVLLERMIYEGKIKYILYRACPRLIPEMWMGYAPEEYQWCKRNEKWLWGMMIERKQLYTPDIAATAKYFSDAPSTFVADGAPGNLGVWMGWQIVEKYMSKTKVSVAELMNNTNCQDILAKSKYKP
ncbi:MAG: gliding motility protein GldB [Tannerella sp.]|jgi:uncharacterized protein YjaZ|nr:gliding motility protein GldB [Tannerella sp.]